MAEATQVSEIDKAYVPDDLLQNLSTLTREQANTYDFGIIKVDDVGGVDLYNKTQSNFAGIPIEESEGHNFFTEVAPCANNGLFYGLFKKGVAAGQLDIDFPYTFTFKMRPTRVHIHLYRDPESQTNWVFCKPI